MSIGRFANGSDSKRKALGLAGEWSPRYRAENEALPSTLSIWDRPVYHPPKMETPRSGANDHLNIKRRGI
jgi:hypothetical protein